MAAEPAVDRLDAVRTEFDVAAMLNLSGLSGRVDRVCELGAGTHECAECMIAALGVDVYEVYGTPGARLGQWHGLPQVVMRPPYARSLVDTESGSVDLVHAQQLFVRRPFVTVVGYLEEMIRVARPGGTVAFGAITEYCIDDVVLRRWIDGDSTDCHVLPRAWTIDMLDRRGLTLLGSYVQLITTGRSELLVFRKRQVRSVR
ncbi:phospholipid methyltransferase [Kribbella sp. NPDC026611]|uniref:phospholipid methyltransferase n=1 Tax=Kribbella sp. NPDC026611 TaxID=3154911 RepID=UPI0033C8C793